MARALASASGQYLQNAAAVLTAMPLTIACWVKPTNFTAANACLGLYDSAAANTRYEIFTVLTTGIIRATHSDNSALATANTSVAATAGVWNHIAGVFTSATSRTAYLNAGSSGSSATNVAGSMAGLNNTTVGLRANSSVSSYLNGSIAEAAIWNVALSQADLTALATGVCPLLIRPDALVFYAPLMGLASPEPDFRGRFSLTLNNTPTASPHTRIYYADGLQDRFNATTVTGIQFDAATNSGYQAASSSYSWSHTCTGTNRFLAVDVSLLSVPGTTVTSITYNGVALSFIGKKSTVTALGTVESWGLANPTSGSNTIAVTLSASIISAGTAVSYSAVHQTSPTNNYNSAQATNVGAADATVNITTIATGSWVHAAVVTDDTAITAGNITRNNVTGAGGSGADEDTGALVAPGSTAMSYTNVGALATWAIGGYELRPDTAPPLGVVILEPGIVGSGFMAGLGYYGG